VSNYVKEKVSDLSSILGATKTQMLDKISSIAASQYSPLGDLSDSSKTIRPVYKVMITVPHVTGGDPISTVPYRYILADTSRPYINFMSKGDSPIIGMWIDQSDLLEPDKAIVLMRNPLVAETGIMESDFVNFPQFGVRNWLDIWMGYAPLTPARSVFQLGDVAHQLGLSLPGAWRSVTYVSPDPFFFGNESHVFSGPIVSVKNKVASKGDILQIIGFSPIIILRQALAPMFNIPEGLTIHDAISYTAESCTKFPNLTTDEGTATPFKRNKDEFYFGQFGWNMFGRNPGEDTYKPKIRDPALRVVPHTMRVDSAWAALYPASSPYKDDDLILKNTKDPKKAKMRRPILPHTKQSIYDVLFNKLTDDSLAGLAGLYAFVRPAPSQTKNTMEAMKDGEGHPGVYIKYGFKFEIEGIQEQIRAKRYGDAMNQKVVLGRTAREIEAGIEYGTVFNSKNFMIKLDGEAGKTKSYLCPTGEEFVGRHNLGVFEHDKPLWEALYQDIQVFGECVHPSWTWLWGEGDKAINLKEGEVANSISQIMRESYFAGMGGSVFAVGRSTFKPGRLLDIKDERRTIGDVIGSSAHDAISKLINFREYKAAPPSFTMKNFDKVFYIWKVRHYLGVNSGYITKVYFVEERNRAWQQYTDSIDQVIRAALGQAKQLMGVV